MELFHKELRDTIPFQSRFEQDTDINIDAYMNMDIDDRVADQKKMRLTSL